MQADPLTGRKEDAFRGVTINRQTCPSPRIQVSWAVLWDYNND